MHLGQIKISNGDEDWQEMCNCNKKLKHIELQQETSNEYFITDIKNSSDNSSNCTESRNWEDNDYLSQQNQSTIDAYKQVRFNGLSVLLMLLSLIGFIITTIIIIIVLIVSYIILN